MKISIASSTLKTIKVFVIAGCTFHLYGQYPGPPEKIGSYSTQHPPDSDAAFPSAIRQDTPVRGAVSVAELQHPLSRKGRDLLTKARDELLAGKTAEGLAELDKALKDPSAMPYAHSMLGATYLALGRMPEAITELRQAVQLLPIAANYSNLGSALSMTGDAIRGEQALQHALELDRDLPQAHYLIGLLLLNRKSRNLEACEHLQWAQRAMPNADIALAVCYARSGQEDAADVQIKKAIGPGDEARLAFWKRWVKWVAAEPLPSLAFGLHGQ